MMALVVAVQKNRLCLAAEDTLRQHQALEFLLDNENSIPFEPSQNVFAYLLLESLGIINDNSAYTSQRLVHRSFGSCVDSRLRCNLWDVLEIVYPGRGGPTRVLRD